MTQSTEAHHHLFQIPPEGFFHLYHRNDPIDADYIRLVLNEFNGEQEWAPARIEAKQDDTEAVVWFTPNPDLPVNERAREIVSGLFGWHMIFNGIVLIEGLDENTVSGIINEG